MELEPTVMNIMPAMKLYGGLELGGTKTQVAIGFDDGTILVRETLPTGSPEDLLPLVSRFFTEHAARHGALAALGVGAFGPIVIDPRATGYGCLLETNKPGWSGFDLAGALRASCGVPVALTTDVGAAGVGEARHGALRGLDLGIYLTVGTGIGGAILCRGQPLPALLHPEMGHIALQRQAGDFAPSVCRFHENCAEGLVAGPAVLARFGKPLSAFHSTSEEVALVADYLGQLGANLVLTLSPQRIVIGGGVGAAPGLVAATRSALLAHLGSYVAQQVQSEGFLCAPMLGQDAGIIGALCSASLAASESPADP